MKIAKAASAAAVGAALLAIDSATMERLSNWTPRSPRPFETEMARHIVGPLGRFGAHQSHVLGWSVLAYAAISTVEGFGLWRGYRWGPWLSVLFTGGFIPLELIEWIRHASAFRTAVLLLNIAVLLYLVFMIGVDLRRKPLTEMPSLGRDKLG